MKNFLLLITLIYGKTTFAQHQAGIGLDLGVSRLYWFNSGEAADGSRWTFMPSGNVGGWYRFRPENSRSSLQLELMISQIEGNVHTEIPVTDSGQNVIGKRTTDTYFHITSVSFPVMYGLHFNRVGILFGAEISAPIFSGYSSRINTVYSGVDETGRTSGSPLYIDRFNFNGRVGFEWGFGKKLSVRASYSHGLNIITRENGIEWKTQQVSIGLRYALMVR